MVAVVVASSSGSNSCVIQADRFLPDVVCRSNSSSRSSRSSKNSSSSIIRSDINEKNNNPANYSSNPKISQPLQSIKNKNNNNTPKDGDACFPLHKKEDNENSPENSFGILTSLLAQPTTKDGGSGHFCPSQREPGHFLPICVVPLRSSLSYS